jgi:hypothetical protein
VDRERARCASTGQRRRFGSRREADRAPGAPTPYTPDFPYPRRPDLYRPENRKVETLWQSRSRSASHDRGTGSATARYPHPALPINASMPAVYQPLITHPDCEDDQTVEDLTVCEQDESTQKKWGREELQSTTCGFRWLNALLLRNKSAADRESVSHNAGTRGLGRTRSCRSLDTSVTPSVPPAIETRSPVNQRRRRAVFRLFRLCQSGRTV